MWGILAVLTFLAGQFYLFYCLGKLDRHIEKSPLEEPAEKDLLSIAFARSVPRDAAVSLVEGFSNRYPQVEIVLRGAPDPVDAVCRGEAALAIVPENTDGRGLCAVALQGKLLHWKGVWREGTPEELTIFLRDSADTGKEKPSVL